MVVEVEALEIDVVGGAVAGDDAGVAGPDGAPAAVGGAAMVGLGGVVVVDGSVVFGAAGDAAGCVVDVVETVCCVVWRLQQPRPRPQPEQMKPRKEPGGAENICCS